METTKQPVLATCRPRANLQRSAALQSTAGQAGSVGSPWAGHGVLEHHLRCRVLIRDSGTAALCVTGGPSAGAEQRSKSNDSLLSWVRTS